jgi:hypothetical protein
VRFVHAFLVSVAFLFLGCGSSEDDSETQVVESDSYASIYPELEKRGIVGGTPTVGFHYGLSDTLLIGYSPRPFRTQEYRLQGIRLEFRSFMSEKENRGLYLIKFDGAHLNSSFTGETRESIQRYHGHHKNQLEFFKAGEDWYLFYYPMP